MPIRRGTSVRRVGLMRIPKQPVRLRPAAAGAK